MKTQRYYSGVIANDNGAPGAGLVLIAGGGKRLVSDTASEGLLVGCFTGSKSSLSSNALLHGL